MAKRRKEYNFSDMIRDTMETLVLSQVEYGKAIGTTQQCISGWLDGNRHPSVLKIESIIKFAVAAKIDSEIYKFKEDSIEVTKDISPYPKDVQKLLISLSDMHPQARRKHLKRLKGCFDLVTRT